MKRIVAIALLAGLVFVLGACSGGGADNDVAAGEGDVAASSEKLESSKDETAQETVAVKPSPDKYTWYVKNYKGMNAASVGYASMGGDRRDSYGAANFKIIFLTNDGSFIDPENTEQLSQYVVTGQDLKPNTEIKLTFLLDENGEEYSNLVDVANYDSIVLSVEKKGSNSDSVTLTPIQPSPDKYTRYVKNYVGMNLASAGYVSMGGDYRDSYAHANVKLNFVADDGSFIDPEDTEALSQYVVTGQDVAPNTEMLLTYAVDQDGVEYDNLIESQSIESISLTVSKVNQE